MKYKSLQNEQRTINYSKKYHVYQIYVQTMSLRQRLKRKYECLKTTFFSVLNVDLNDINNFTYAESLTVTKSIDKN